MSGCAAPPGRQRKRGPRKGPTRAIPEQGRGGGSPLGPLAAKADERRFLD